MIPKVRISSLITVLHYRLPQSTSFLPHECLSKNKNRDKILNLVFFHFPLHETSSLEREGVEI